MRTRFEEQLTRLNAELIDMGTLIEHAIVESTQALGARDVVRAAPSWPSTATSTRRSARSRICA